LTVKVNDVVGAAKSISDVAQAIWNKNASSNGTNATSVAHAAARLDLANLEGFYPFRLGCADLLG